MSDSSTSGARARRGAGNEPKRKRAREDGRPPTKRHTAEPPRSGRNGAAPDLPTTPYERTDLEQQTVEAWRTRLRDKPRMPAIRVTEDKTGAQILSLDHPYSATASILLHEALGSTSYEFTTALLDQLSNAVTRGPKASESGLNFALAVVAGIQPRDEIEVMLAAQMATAHMATMTFSRRLAHVDNIAQQDSAERAFNKLARTFAAQVEALKRYRSAGEQTVRVEHVTVNEGGQAIVGNITTRGGGFAAKDGGNLMNAVYPFQRSSRRTATSKRTREPCQAPAVNGWAVCRFHGARGGAPTGKRNGMYRHGGHTKEAVAMRREVSDLQREVRALLRRLWP